MTTRPAAAPAEISRFNRLKQALSPEEWRRVGALALAVAALHLIGIFILFAVVVPQHLTLGKQGIFGLGIGVTAYTLGLRHAFDADHIAAIDNTTRKLITDGQRPLGVGFFFSLGHSTVVFVVALLLAAGVKLGGQLVNDEATLRTVGSLVGAGASGAFLYLIAAFNLAILISILKVFRKMRRGGYDERELEHHLDSRGLMNRFFRRFTGSITKSWHMYPVGALFGVGFDTATEVALLFLAGGAALADVPFYAILCLPVLFAAGMSLLDTIDGAFMNFAYGWALSKPIRKIYYNITVTWLSVTVAFLIGTIELVPILVEKLGLRGGAWDMLAGLDLNELGYLIVGLFVVTWLGALTIWRLGRIEEKWTAAIKRD